MSGDYSNVPVTPEQLRRLRLLEEQAKHDGNMLAHEAINRYPAAMRPSVSRRTESVSFVIPELAFQGSCAVTNPYRGSYLEPDFRSVDDINRIYNSNGNYVPPKMVTVHVACKLCTWKIDMQGLATDPDGVAFRAQEYLQRHMDEKHVPRIAGPNEGDRVDAFIDMLGVKKE